MVPLLPRVDCTIALPRQKSSSGQLQISRVGPGACGISPQRNASLGSQLSLIILTSYSVTCVELHLDQRDALWYVIRPGGCDVSSSSTFRFLSFGNSCSGGGDNLRVYGYCHCLIEPINKRIAPSDAAIEPFETFMMTAIGRPTPRSQRIGGNIRPLASDFYQFAILNYPSVAECVPELPADCTQKVCGTSLAGVLFGSAANPLPWPAPAFIPDLYAVKTYYTCIDWMHGFATLSHGAGEVPREVFDSAAASAQCAAQQTNRANRTQCRPLADTAAG